MKKQKQQILEKGGEALWLRKHDSQQDSQELITSHKKNVEQNVKYRNDTFSVKCSQYLVFSGFLN